MAEPLLTPQVEWQIHNQLVQDAFRRTGSLALMGLGAGAGARGLMGLWNTIRPKKQPRSGVGTTTLDMPVLAHDEKQAAMGRPPQAGVTHPASLWWALPAWTAAAAGGIAGGWKGLDHVLDQRRKQELDSELDTARNQFQQALLQEQSLKSAEEGSLARELDLLADEFEKVAGDNAEPGLISQLANYAVSPDFRGQGVGAYLTYAGAAGLLAGLEGYRRAQATSKREVLDKALQQRRRRLYAQQPNEVYARPIPTSLASPTGGV